MIGFAEDADLADMYFGPLCLALDRGLILVDLNDYFFGNFERGRADANAHGAYIEITVFIHRENVGNISIDFTDILYALF